MLRKGGHPVQMAWMGAKRVVWHVGFGMALRRRGSRAFEVRDEVPLSEQPPRLDYLLLRKGPVPPDDDPQTLRRLWPLLPQLSIVEYKSPGRPYRTGDLDRLWGYVHLFHADGRSRPGRRQDLCAVLAVPGRTPSLDADVEQMGLSWEDLGDGYWRVNKGLFTLWVVELNRVGQAEGDDLLYSLGSGELLTARARWFWIELVGSTEAGMSMEDMDGYEELMSKLLKRLPAERMVKVLDELPAEEVLSHYAPEQRLAHCAPEQRLAGLDRDHQALALPLEVLRLLPEQYIASLSTEVQDEIRRRLRRDAEPS
jgi:hypothetical protein